MGDASRRRRAIVEWLNALSDDERIVAETAIKLMRGFPDDGACYRKAFFLRQFLRVRHGIDANAIVGFVNDGTDQIYASHAWLEFQGKKVDVALARPMQPDIQQRGPVLILDFVYAPGWSGYTYHRERPAEGVAHIEELLRDPQARAFVAASEDLHRTMAATAMSDALIAAYLDNAPDGIDFGRTAELVDRTNPH